MAANIKKFKVGQEYNQDTFLSPKNCLTKVVYTIAFMTGAFWCTVFLNNPKGLHALRF